MKVSLKTKEGRRNAIVVFAIFLVICGLAGALFG